MTVAAVCLATGLSVLSARSVWAGPIELTKDNENVVADRIVGTWLVNDTLTEHLRPSSDKSGSLPPVEFVSDDAVADAIPEKFSPFFQDKPAFMAGVMRLGSVDFPFVLTTYHGNPTVIYFTNRGSDPFGDAAMFNVMLVAAEKSAADMLFLGGPVADIPFTAFLRATTDDAASTDAQPKAADTSDDVDADGEPGPGVAGAGGEASVISASVAATSSATQSDTDPRDDEILLAQAEVRVTVGEAARLLDEGDHVQFLRRFALPADLAMVTDQRPIELLARQFARKKAPRLRETLHRIIEIDLVPAISDDGLTATFQVNSEHLLTFERTLGRWCLRN